MSSALAFLTGLGTGYITSKDKEAKQAREDEDRAMRKDEHTARMDVLKRDEANRQALMDAGAPIAMTQGAGGMLKPETMDNRDVGLPENAALPNEGLRQGSYSVAGKSFADAASAQTELASQNTPDAVNTRILAAQRRIDPSKAIAMEQGIAQSKLSAVQLKAAELTQKHDAAFREVTESFTKGGWSSIPKIYESYNDGNSATVTEDGKGGAIVNVLNKDGKQIGQKSYANEMEFITGTVATLDPKLWVSMKEKQADKAQTQSNADRDFDLRKKDGENTQEYRARTLGIQASQERRAAETHAVTMQDAKVPTGVKMQATSLAEQIKAVNAAISTAMANNSFEPNTANAQSLLARQANLGNSYTKLMNPYTKAGDPNTDILGLGGGAPAPSATAAPAAKGNAAQTTPMPAAAPAAPQATTAPAAPRPASKPAALSTIDQIQADSVTALMPLAAQVKQAEATYIAAARSGDPTATARYAAEKQALSAQLNEAVNAKFGNAAPKVLQQLFAQ